MSRIVSILLICLSGIISLITAVGWINYGAAELAALIYLVIPLAVLGVSVIIYLLSAWKIPAGKTSIVIIMIVLNILTGILMRIDFYYNLFNW